MPHSLKSLTLFAASPCIWYRKQAHTTPSTCQKSSEDVCVFSFMYSCPELEPDGLKMYKATGCNADILKYVKCNFLALWIKGTSIKFLYSKMCALILLFAKMSPIYRGYFCIVTLISSWKTIILLGRPLLHPGRVSILNPLPTFGINVHHVVGKGLWSKL